MMRSNFHRLALAAALAGLAGCGGADDPPAADLPPKTPLLVESRRYQDLEYSPDGTRIAYVATDSGGQRIFVANADGSGSVPISSVADEVVDPDWSPDGLRVTYSSSRYGPPETMVVSAQGGEERRVTPGDFVDWYPSFSTDGSQVVFYSSRSGNYDIWVAPVDGGEPRPVTSGPEADRYPRFSPDGRWIAFDREVGGRSYLALYSVQDGAVRQASTEGFEDFQGEGWSPDSREVLYLSSRAGTRDVWTHEIETGEHRQLTRDIRDDFGASYSPDGRWVAFVSRRGGQDDVWIVPAAGGEAIRVTDDAEEESGVRWRPDSRGLAFIRDDGLSSIRALDPETGATRRVVEVEGDATLYDVSPEAGLVVYGIEVAGGEDIHVAPLDGGEPYRITSSPSQPGPGSGGVFAPETNARFSPDGSRIAYRASRLGEYNLFVVPTEGGEAIRITDRPSGAPSWSPSGELIAFEGGVEDGSGSLFVVPSDGGEARRLTDPTGTSYIRWHPDGSRITFSSGPAGFVQIYSVRVDGSGLTNLTADGPHMAARAEWSPDGTAFTYYGTVEDPTRFDPWVANADGTGHRPVAEIPGWQWRPFFSADGTRIYYHSLTEGENNDLAVVALDGGATRPLLETPENEEFLTRDPGTGELYFTHRELRNQYVTVEVGALLDAAGGGG